MPLSGAGQAAADRLQDRHPLGDQPGGDISQTIGSVQHADVRAGQARCRLLHDLRQLVDQHPVQRDAVVCGRRVRLQAHPLRVGLGQDPDSFNIRNPSPTSGGFYLAPGGSPFLYSVATSFDLMMFWALFLTALGLSIIGKKLKLSTAMIVVFGWYGVVMLVSAGLAAGFS